MVLPIAFALMGRSMSEKGRQDQEEALDRQRRRAAEDEQRAAEREERQFRQSERARMMQSRDAVMAAAKPVSPVSGEIPQTAVDDDGNMMPPNPTAGSFKVGDQRFADRASADAAAATENSPDRVGDRVARAMMSTGDFAGAQTLRTGARQERAAQQQEADEAFRRDLFAGMQQGRFDGLATVLTKSSGDGAGGKAQFRAVPSADGKKVALQQFDGGKVVGTVGEFENNDNGLMMAGFMLDRGTKPERKMEHLVGERRFTAERGDRDRDFSLREKDQERRAAHEQRLLANSNRQLALAERAQNASEARASAGPVQAPVWDKDADKFLRERYTFKDANDREAVDGEGMSFSKAIAFGQAQANGGDTTRALGYAFDRDNQLRAAATDQKGNYDQAKHSALRREYMNRLQNGSPPVPVSAPPVAPAAPTARPQAVAAAPAVVDSGLTPEQEQAGHALDTARSATQAARQRFMSYGLRQKANDPQGFSQAEQQFMQARAAEQAAMAQYQRALQTLPRRLVPMAQP